MFCFVIVYSSHFHWKYSIRENAIRTPLKPVFNVLYYRVAIRQSRTEIYPSIFNAEINASCGISTFPNCRMRFFPAFCFSKSFFFRVTSPP